MKYDYITDSRGLVGLCHSISHAPAIAFDTEFVSEDSYLPQLCLVQVAAAGRLALIDALTVNDLTPFWRLLATPGHETLVHAGREELRFCRRAIGERPHCLLDVQIAAGMAGLDYPAAYSTLVSRLLNQTLGKGETRSNWRRRPLSQRQLDYAVQDVCHLEPLRDVLRRRIDELGRSHWLEAELAAWQDELEAAEQSQRWRLVPGVSGLPPRSLAIVRELWRWRDAEAKRTDHPARRVLRDDLLVELARCQTGDVKRIRTVRGLDWSRMRKHLSPLADCIQKALALPENQWPRPAQRRPRPQLNVLAQFLTTALGNVCRSAQIAPALVGTSEDIHEFIAARLQTDDAGDDGPPVLASGWRAEIVGQVLDDVLAGRLSLRVADPLSSQPLVFEPSASGRDMVGRTPPGATGIAQQE